MSSTWSPVPVRSQERCAKAHKSNLKVIVWTINTGEEAKLYIAKDVDGIATDKPGIFKGIAS